ncbi:flagellar basal body rod protein FlgB [Rubinisphaera margarita]|uniref:flagellar basal body rod protein FlgB n=1 Tax=Rubinisphaera margarita TaxID=2909586 RepID=UPI001EE94470|nr:hypothetical protein [Rubinisphaera margarita]MCG6154501.1 hypothetical protein [Rubinisphaera margarita]
MIDPFLQQTTVPLLERVAAFGQQRHAVLAGNIANIDTPDYQPQDLPVQDFERALRQAVEARRQQDGSQPLLPPSLGVSPANGSLSHLVWQQPTSGIQGAPAVGDTQRRTEDFFPASLSKAEPVRRNLTFHDGASRSIEQESMEMVKNASMQSFAIEVMRNQLNILESVISERVV